MSLQHFVTLVSVLVAVVTLVALLCAALMKDSGISQRRWEAHDFSARLMTKTLLLFAIWIAVIWRIHTGCPRQHRLFFDEDVYANMTHNLLHGYGATVTASWLGDVKQTHPHKWPLAFPALTLPFVVPFGLEQGPAIFNEWCGALTLAVLMALAARVAATSWAAVAVAVFFGAHPIVGGWYRSGSAEPLSVLLVTLSFWAAVKAHESKTTGDVRPQWTMIALLSAALSLHVRLENILIALPLFSLFRRSRLGLRRRQMLFSGLILLPLFSTFVAHVLTLKKYYWADLPVSRFSGSYFAGNLLGNIGFLFEYGPGLAVLVVAVACVLIFTKRVSPCSSSSRHLLGAVILFSSLKFVLLLFYSVGQYDAPGGSRFFLIQAVPLALTLAVFFAGLASKLLCHVRETGNLQAGAGERRFFGRPSRRLTGKLQSIITGATRPGLIAVAIVLYLLMLPGRESTWQKLDDLNRSPALEHAAIQTWSGVVPADALLVSHLPYIWENLGKFSISYQLAQKRETMPSKPVYYHHGLFNDSMNLAAQHTLTLDSLTAEHGAIMLYQLRGRGK